MDKKNMMQEGKYYLLNIIPGWILSGKVVKVNETFGEFSHAAWIENNQKSVFELTAKNPKVRDISTSVHPIYGAHFIDLDFVSMVSEISESTALQLYNFENQNAIRNA